MKFALWSLAHLLWPASLQSSGEGNHILCIRAECTGKNIERFFPSQLLHHWKTSSSVFHYPKWREISINLKFVCVALWLLQRCNRLCPGLKKKKKKTSFSSFCHPGDSIRTSLVLPTCSYSRGSPKGHLRNTCCRQNAVPGAVQDSCSRSCVLNGDANVHKCPFYVVS